MHAVGAKKLGWGGRSAYDRQRTRDVSVKIEPSWTLLEEIEFPRIAKLQFTFEEDPQLLESMGRASFYNRAFDRVSTKASRAVSLEDVPLPAYVRVAEDPVVQRLAAARAGESTTYVFMSDTVAALLMATPRTAFPWDLTVHRAGNIVHVDQRADARLDQTLVGETSADPPSDDREQLNSAVNLSAEATRLSAGVSRLLSAEQEAKVFGPDLPGQRSLVHQYYQWSLGPDVRVVIRSEFNGMARVGDQPRSMLLRAVLEYTGAGTSRSSIDWRSKLDNQRSAVLAAEIKNNNAMVARWVYQALLSGVDLIKFAYVARASPNDRVRHELLALQDLEPEELASQMNLDVANGFGILKAFTDLILGMRGCSDFALIRDPVKVRRPAPIPNSPL